MKVKRVVIGLLLLSAFCIASFNIGVKYNTEKDLNINRKYYINSTYFKIDHMIRLLSAIDNWDDSINKPFGNNPYRQLINGIHEMKLEADQANYYMIEDKNRAYLSGLSDSCYLLEGYIDEGTYYSNILVSNGFLKDGVMSDSEKAFLISLKQDLQNIKDKMYSNETHQENPNLSLKDMSEIFKPFIDKYSVGNLSKSKIDN